MKEVMRVAVERTSDEFDVLMEKGAFWKTFRVASWVMRYIHNYRSSKKMKRTGPLTTEETTNQTYFCIRRTQMDVEETDNKARLNPQKNEHQIYV